MSNLRKSLIRLARSNPEIREHVLPLLKADKVSSFRDPKQMSEEKALGMVDEILAEVGGRAKDSIASIRVEIREFIEQERAIERAWEKWDLKALQAFGILSRDELRFIEETWDLYGWPS
jgi:hypothetical protein